MAITNDFDLSRKKEEKKQTTGRDRLAELLATATDEPANKRSKEAVAQLQETGHTTYRGKEYTLPETTPAQTAPAQGSGLVLPTTRRTEPTVTGEDVDQAYEDTRQARRAAREAELRLGDTLPDYYNGLPTAAEYEAQQLRIRAAEQEAASARRASDAASQRYESLAGEYQKAETRRAQLAAQSSPDFTALSMGDEETALKNVGKPYYQIFHRKDTTAPGAAQQEIPGKTALGSLLLSDVEYQNQKLPSTGNPYAFMYDDEAATYFYYWNTPDKGNGPKAANAYLEQIMPELNARAAAYNQLAEAEYARQHPVLASGMSVPANLAGGVTGMIDLTVQNIGAAAGNRKPIDYNTPAQMAGKTAQNYRSTVGEMLAEKYPASGLGGTLNWASFAYQTGMSMVDSGIQAMAAGGFAKGSLARKLIEGIGLALLGGSAAQQSVYAAKERGASDGQALLSGYAAGIAEAAFEKISLDNLVDNIVAKNGMSIGDKLTKNWVSGLLGKLRGAASWVINTGIQGAVEGSEEVATTLANTLTDVSVNRARSELLSKVEEYQRQGLSPDAALNTALKEWGYGLIQDALGGFVSGGIMGGAGTGAHYLGEYAGGLKEDIETARAQTDLQTQQAQMQDALREAGALPDLEAERQANEPQLRLPTADPLGAALNKLSAGQAVSNSDAKAILDNPQAMQTLRDSGVLTNEGTTASEQRAAVKTAVQALAEQQTAQEAARAAQEERQTREDTSPAQEETPRTETPTAQEETPRLTLPVNEPLTNSSNENNLTLPTNNQEVTNNGERQQTEAADSGRLFIEQARKAAGQVSYGSERSTRLGRFGENLAAQREYRRQDRAGALLRSQAAARNLGLTSAAELGVDNGSDDQTFRVLDTPMLNRTQRQTVAKYAAKGVKLDFIQGQMALNEYDENGRQITARAWVSKDNKHIVVQADHPSLTWKQLLDHEEYHRRIQEDKGYRDAVQNALLADERVAPHLSEIVDRYTEAYARLGVKDPTKVVEEMLADYRAGFDMLTVARGEAGNRKLSRAAAETIHRVEEGRASKAVQAAEDAGATVVPEKSTEQSTADITDAMAEGEVGEAGTYSYEALGAAGGFTAVEKDGNRYFIDQNGKYIPQGAISLSSITTGDIIDFAKNNVGRQYNEQKSQALAEKIREVYDQYGNDPEAIAREVLKLINESKQQESGEEGSYSLEFDSSNLPRTYVEYNDKQTRYIKVREAMERQIENGKTITITQAELKAYNDAANWDNQTAARKYVEGLFRDILGQSVDLSIGDGTITAYLTKKGLDHFTKYVAPEKAAAASKFYEIIANSRYAYSSNIDSHGNSGARAWDYFVCPVTIEGSKQTVPFLLSVRTIDGDLRSQIYGMGYNPYTRKNIEAAIPRGSGSQENATRHPSYRESTASNFNNTTSGEEVKSQSDGKTSLEIDTDYLSAVESGDMDTAQRMVDEAAKAAGYAIRAYHGTGSQFTVFDKSKIGSVYGADEVGFFFSSKKEVAEWAASDASSKVDNERIIDAFLKIESPLEITTKEDPNNYYDSHQSGVLQMLYDGEHDGIIINGSGSTTYIVFEPEQIKSADPVTYDDDGKPIPLSKRFDTENADIRYSIEIDPEVAAQFSPEAIALRQQRRQAGRGKKKVSKVRSNTYAVSGLFNEVEAQMEEANEQNYTYNVESERETMNKALHRLETDFSGSVKKLSSSEVWDGTDVDTAMGILHQYRTEGRMTGDYTDFWNWSHEIQRRITKDAKALQAMDKYSRTGTGTAQKAAEDLRKQHELNPAQKKRVTDAARTVRKGADTDKGGAAEDALKQAKGKKQKPRKATPREVQRMKDAERLVREIYNLFERQQTQHGAPVTDWLHLTGEELARKIAGRFAEPKAKTKTTMQIILGDLVKFAEEHALPERQKGETQRRTAIDTIADYLNNRDAYGEAWAQAQAVLRGQYANDQEKLDALENFLGATISYNAEGTDRTMLDAILQSADVLGISEKRILELASTGVTDGTVRRIADELVSQVKERLGTDYDESFTQQLRDAVRRHVYGIVLQESAEDQRLRLTGLETDAARKLDIKLQQLLTESKLTKQDAARRVADYLITELGIPAGDAAIAAQRIGESFMDELAARADKRLQGMFAEKTPKAQKQRDKLLELLRLGGFTNANVEDAVADAMGIGHLSREEQKRITADMARFGETLDAMLDDDLEGLRQLIREQAAVRKTPLSRQAEKVLQGTTDAQYLREFALAQLASIAGDYAPRGRGQKLSTYQTLSHLLNMRTALRNIGSNQVFDLVASAANNVGMLPDAIASAFTSKRTVGLDKSWASKMKRQGAVEGAGRNLLEVRLDVSPDERNKSKYGTGGRRTWSMANSGTVGKILSHLEEAMGYELNTTDEWHKGSVFAETIESLARFVDAGQMTMEEAKEFAEQEALYRSFQDDTKIGSMLRTFKDALNIIGVGTKNGKKLGRLPVHDFGLGDLVIKYTQVPGALIHRTIEFSPVGYVKALYDIGVLLNETKKGGNITKAQRNMALSFGRATTGTGLMVIFYALAKLGLLRRDEDDSDKNAKAMHQAQGFSGTQLNLSGMGRWLEGKDPKPEDGDVLADVNFLEPMDGLMAIATMLAKSDDFSLRGVANQSINGVFESISGLSVIQTLNSIYNVIQYHNDDDKTPYWKEIAYEVAAGSLSGFIPSPVRQFAQATDTVYRDQYRSKDMNDQIRAKVMNSIPGLRQQLAPKITPLGEDKQYQKPVLNYLNATLNPGNINVYQANRVVDELNRVYGETDDAKIWPERNAPYSVSINQQSYTLTPDERTQYQRTRGQETARIMEDVIGTGWYKEMDVEQQAKVLNDIGNLANYAAKVEFSEGRGIDYSSDTYAKAYAELQTGSPADAVALLNKKAVAAAEEIHEAVQTIAAAPIPETSKAQVEEMTPDEKVLYAGFLKGGVTDTTARDLAKTMSGSESSGHEQWREIYTAAPSAEREKAVTSVMTDDMKRNWNLAKSAGVGLDDYIKVRESYNDLDEDGRKEQKEWNATLDSMKFSTDSTKDKRIKGTLWQILTGSNSTKYNPYDKDAGQKVIDAKAKGGGSSGGLNAMARSPALKLPTVSTARRSSGLVLPTR